MTSKIVNAPLQAIHYNPFRLINNYPIIKTKLEGLLKSINDVGFWEGVIARDDPEGSGYQLAFGHHRYEAAKAAGLKTIPLIVRKLTDKQMVQFMGRENGEDYKTDFKVMLNSWDGAITFSRQAANSIKPVEIARLLGWIRKDPAGKNGSRMNDVAKACANASTLITEKVMTADDFEGVSVKSADQIASRATTTLKEVKKRAEKLNLTPEQTQIQKEHVGKGAAITAKKVKEGKIPTSNLRGEVDADIFGSRKKEKINNTPLFAKFAISLSDRLDKVLIDDAISEKLLNIAENKNAIVMQEDVDAIKFIDNSLADLEKRIVKWRKSLVLKPLPKTANTVPIAITGEVH